MGCVVSRDGKTHRLATKPARTLTRPAGVSQSQWRHEQAVLQANAGFGFTPLSSPERSRARVAKVVQMSPRPHAEPTRQARWSPSVDAGELFADQVPKPESNASWVPPNKVGGSQNLAKNA